MTTKYEASQRRKALEDRLHSTYKLAPNHEGGCIYCGAKSSGKDHVPPLFHAETVSKDGSGRWLHDCCGPCNVLLSAYPAVCLKVRAEYLLCVLRREWLLTRNGLKRKYPNSVISTKGLRVKARLASGITQSLCLCKNCKAVREKENPELPQHPAPYGGKEISYGRGYFSFGFFDEGLGA